MSRPACAAGASGSRSSPSIVAVTSRIYTLSLHDALPICHRKTFHHFGGIELHRNLNTVLHRFEPHVQARARRRSEEHTSELQSRGHLVCRPLLEKKKSTDDRTMI